jgi:5-formyltetrahydrofolate cyclo-ligase
LDQQTLQNLGVTPTQWPQGNALKGWLAAGHAGKITLMDTSAKAQLRSELLGARPHSSVGLTEQLIKLVESRSPAKVASYSPIANEPDVSEFNDWLADKGMLLLPRIVDEGLEFATGSLARGPMGILEPQGPKVAPDLLIIPAVAVDLRGNRLGRGKGFYDRALAQLEVPAFAVVFASEVIEKLPFEPHDRAVNGVVTPARTVIFD